MLFQRAFWLNLAGACLVAVVAAVPILTNDVMDRAFEIAKQSVAEPLSLLAFGAALLAGGWRSVLQQTIATRIAAISFATFLGSAAVATILSDTPEVALFGGYFRREGLIAWCAYGAFFFGLLGWAQHSGRSLDFLDALLLASVIPAAYTIQQRLGLDFYVNIDRDTTRPGGTLGNPLFIAAYLGILLPVTVARCWRARGVRVELLIWSCLLVLQGCAFLIAQSRGPLAAVIAGLTTLALLIAGYARGKRIFLAAIVVPALAVSLVLALNMLPRAKHWAQDTPFLSRLVFDMSRDAGEATWRASRSIATRVGIWEAGNATFAAAPLQNQLLGYGPESAHMHFLLHLPASVMRTESYVQDIAWDRLHADALDIGLNFGLVGWLCYCIVFAAAIYASARALFGLNGRGPPWMFLGFMFAGGTLASLTAVLPGFGSAAVPAFGLGVGAGWIFFLVCCAWRALRHGVPRTVGRPADDWMLLAALTASLLVFWIDVQVNVPVLTTRLIAFGLVALILVMAGNFSDPKARATGAESAGWGRLWVWGVAFSLVAACASFLPVVSFEPAMPEQDTQRWWLRMMPMLAAAAFAVWTASTQAQQVAGGAKVARAWVAIAAGVPLFYAAAHFALALRLGPEVSLGDVQRVAMASFAAPLFIFATCIALASMASLHPAKAMEPAISGSAPYAMIAVAASVLAVVYFDWRGSRADVAWRAAQWPRVNQAQASEQLAQEAIRLMPFERVYRKQLVIHLLGKAVSDIRRLRRGQDRYPMVERNLAEAERQAREALRLRPRDPAFVLALANVLQMRALRILRSHDPARGQNAAVEANQLFETAHKMFPAQPIVLRNWAQLLFDEGNLADAYLLLDLMEKLIPDQVDPYAERIIMARQAGDSAVVSATVERARRVLEEPLFRQLLTVAKAQQK